MTFLAQLAAILSKEIVMAIYKFTSDLYELKMKDEAARKAAEEQAARDAVKAEENKGSNDAGKVSGSIDDISKHF